MNNLPIEFVGSEFRVDSRLLSPYLDHRHRTIMESITKHLGDYNELGIVTFQTERLLTENLGYRDHKYALLNEDHCYLLLTYMRNNASVREKKVKLVKAFRDARAQLALRDMARIEGKAVRRTETDAIKDLVEYATAKGSSNAKMYYASITRMTNDLLGIESGMRDKLEHKQLQQIKVAETIVEMAIRDGLKAELNYKDIYKLCKERVSAISSVLLG